MTNHIFARSFQPRGAEVEVTPPRLPAPDRCGKCLSVKRAGVSHPCGPAAKRRNLLALLGESPEHDQRAVVGSAVKSLAKSNTNGGSLDLKRVGGGHPVKVMIGEVGDGGWPKLNANTFRRIEVEMDMARSSLLKLIKILRGEVGISSRVKEALKSWDRVGADQLSLERIQNFEQKIAARRGGKGEKGVPAHEIEITRDAVVVKDVSKMVDWVVTERGMVKQQTVVRGSMDGGGGSLKILASIFQESELSRAEQPGFLLTGVNRILLLAFVEDLQESWHNLRILLELVNLSSISYRLAADLKLINIVLGISSHSGKYACFICYGECHLSSGPLRTYQHLKDMYEKYEACCRPRGMMSRFYNVIKPCLVSPENLATFIGDVIPPPPLHLHIGVANSIWALVKVLVGEGCYQQPGVSINPENQISSWPSL